MTYYGHMLRVLACANSQVMTNALAEMDLTASQGHVMGYIAMQPVPPCPHDIEEEFQLSHPTVSGLLSRLEKKGFIELKTDPSDRRVRRIYILPKGLACHETMHSTIQSIEARLVAGFTEEEKAQFDRLLARAGQNMGVDPNIRKHKEEPDK